MPICGVGWGITLLNGIDAGNNDVVRITGRLE